MFKIILKMLKKKFEYFIDYFEKNMPVAESELNYENPYQLIVAVILSAQCTDKRVNITTPALFARFPDAFSLANSNVDEIYSYIKSISYPNNKAEHEVNPSLGEISVFNIFFPANNGFVNPGVATIFIVEDIIDTQIEIQVFEQSLLPFIININITYEIWVETS